MTAEAFEKLEKRVADLEATMAIIALEGRYARTWDTSDALGWADLFTPGGVFERVDVEGKPGHRKAGRAELAQLLRGGLPPHAGRLADQQPTGTAGVLP